MNRRQSKWHTRLPVLFYGVHPKTNTSKTSSISLKDVHKCVSKPVMGFGENTIN